MKNNLNTIILAPIILLLVVCLGIGAGILYYGLSNLFYRSLEQKVALTESFLLKVTPELMWNFDTEGMAGYASSIVQDHEMTSLNFLNEKGEPFSKDMKAAPSPSSEERRISHDIVVDDAKIGSFTLTYTTAIIHQKLRWLLLAVIGGVVLILGVLGFTIHHTVGRATQPLANLSNLFTSAAKNADLTVNIPEDKTVEIGVLGRALNHFSGRLRTTLQNVQALGFVVKENVVAIGSNSDRVTEMVSNQQQASTEIAAAVKDSAENLYELNTLTQNTANQLQEMVVLAGGADQIMKNLEGTSGQIQGVLEVITSIAESTNLLALNAAIEAARAGDAGRGFAVVADEVKKLSKKTMESTSQIGGTIHALKDDILATQKQVASITGAIGNIQNNMQLVAAATERQSATMEEVSSTVTSFLGQFNTTQEAMHESQGRIGKLLDEVQQLDSNLRVFKV